MEAVNNKAVEIRCRMAAPAFDICYNFTSRNLSTRLRRNWELLHERMKVELRIMHHNCLGTDHDYRVNQLHMAPGHWLRHASDYRCCRCISHRPVCHLPKSCSLVRGTSQTIIQSAQLGLRTSMDDTLCVDGICRVAHSAAAGSVWDAALGADSIFYSARAQRGVVVDVFWCQ